LITELLDQSKAARSGLHIGDAYRVYEWSKNGYQVFFSATSHDNTIAIHLAAPQDSKRCLRLAVNEFVDYLFNEFEWCEVVMGAVVPVSVVNLAKKCGFIHLADALIGEDSAEGKIMARFR
jgi:hypothetical protein